MKFESIQIKGRGRARKLGYPTINLEIPQSFKLKHGVYGANFIVDGKKYLAALHYGPSPTFLDKTETLEIYLIEMKDREFPVIDKKNLEVEVLKYLRKVEKFESIDKLIQQIEKDIENIKLLA